MNARHHGMGSFSFENFIIQIYSSKCGLDQVGGTKIIWVGFMAWLNTLENFPQLAPSTTNHHVHSILPHMHLLHAAALLII